MRLQPDEGVREEGDRSVADGTPCRQLCGQGGEFHGHAWEEQESGGREGVGEYGAEG